MKKLNLVIEYIPISQIKANPKNVMTHPPEQLEEIRTSMRLYGFNDPLAWDENDELIEGHGRLEAAELEGYTEAPIFRLTHLSDGEKRAYMIAHNRIPRNAKWDEKRLSNEFSELLALNISIDTLGFNEIEIDNILRDGKKLLPDDGDDGHITVNVQPHTRTLNTTRKKKFSVIVDFAEDKEKEVKKLVDLLTKRNISHRVVER